MNPLQKPCKKNNGYKNQKYKTFHETFPICAFAMALGLVYPNKFNIKKKKVFGALIIAVNFAELFWFVTYLVKCIFAMDIYNVTRNVTIGIVVFLFFFKSFYVNTKTKLFVKILDCISTDLLNGNQLDENYQELYDHYITEGKFGEKVWVIIPVVLSSLFPACATGAIIYRVITEDPQPKVMVHDMDLMFLMDKQYKTPYFEIIFFYNLLQCAVLAPNFTGFDGSFCISITHLSMKLKLFTRKLARVFKESTDNIELEAKVKEAIKDHQEALEFHALLQEVYGGWLFAAFFLTSTVVSFNLYQLSLSGGADPKYFVFALCAVCHVLAPCYFASNLLKVGEEVCNEIYDVPWESCACSHVPKLFTFVIARAQEPLVLTGKGMVIYNMELFVSVLQTSYSFFTLIRS